MRFRPAAALLLPAVLFAQPKRIVSATPSVTEMLFALGLGERVVGVTEHCRYPEAARRLPKIGTYMNPNSEAIAALRPDLVVIQKNPYLPAAALERLKLRALELNYDSVEEVYRGIERLSAAAGVPERGAALVARLKAELAAVGRATAGRPRRSAAFFVARQPDSTQGLIAVGSASYLRELIEIAGGRNVFGDAAAAYPKIPLEELIARNPDVIIDMGDMAQTRGVTEAHRRSVVELWNRHPVLKAVRENRIYAVANDIFVVPGPRMAEAARAFARMLHPELGPEAFR
jgi:iron complex transport system substrate-binding protein